MTKYRKKWSFPLSTSSVNVTISAGKCKFGHIKSLMENFIFRAVGNLGDSIVHCTKNGSFPSSISSVNVTKSEVFLADLVTFTEEILNGKLHFLCCGFSQKIAVFFHCSNRDIPVPCIYFFYYTNADLKISLYVCFHIKNIPWKFCILNPKSSRIICPWSLQIS